MPRDAVSRTANVERTGRHKWVNMLGAVTRCVGHWLIAKCSNKQDLHILEASFFKEFNLIINRQTNDFVRELKIF